MKKSLMGLLVVASVIGGWWLLKSEKQGEIIDDPIKVERATSDTNNWWESAGVEVADLADVSGGDGSGMGYLSRTESGITHRVVASLPPLEGDNFYEGWLVKKSPTLEFFSTGEMRLEGDKYTLDYTSSELREGYGEVVITLETKRDETPEGHVLEGTLTQQLGASSEGDGYLLSEVSTHDSKEDCWLAIDGTVYDMSSYIADGFHPGKLAIILGCGKDATELFDTRPMGSGTAHSDSARNLLPKYEIGKLITN